MSIDLNLNNKSAVSTIGAALADDALVTIAMGETLGAVLSLDDDNTIVYHDAEGDRRYVGFDNVESYGVRDAYARFFADDITPWQAAATFLPLPAEFETPEAEINELGRLVDAVADFCKARNLPVAVAVMHGDNEKAESHLIRFWTPADKGRASQLHKRIHEAIERPQLDLEGLLRRLS